MKDAGSESYQDKGNWTGLSRLEISNIKGDQTHTCIYSQEKAMAPHSSTLAWKILWTEEPGRLQSMGSLRVGHD